MHQPPHTSFPPCPLPPTPAVMKRARSPPPPFAEHDDSEKHARVDGAPSLLLGFLGVPLPATDAGYVPAELNIWTCFGGALLLRGQPLLRGLDTNACGVGPLDALALCLTSRPMLALLSGGSGGDGDDEDEDDKNRRTPALVRLAREGGRFLAAYRQATSQPLTVTQRYMADAMRRHEAIYTPPSLLRLPGEREASDEDDDIGMRTRSCGTNPRLQTWADPAVGYMLARRQATAFAGPLEFCAPIVAFASGTLNLVRFIERLSAVHPSPSHSPVGTRMPLVAHVPLHSSAIMSVRLRAILAVFFYHAPTSPGSAGRDWTIRLLEEQTLPRAPQGFVRSFFFPLRTRPPGSLVDAILPVAPPFLVDHAPAGRHVLWAVRTLVCAELRLWQFALLVIRLLDSRPAPRAQALWTAALSHPREEEEEAAEIEYDKVDGIETQIRWWLARFHAQRERHVSPSSVTQPVGNETRTSLCRLVDVFLATEHVPWLLDLIERAEPPMRLPAGLVSCQAYIGRRVEIRARSPAFARSVQRIDQQLVAFVPHLPMEDARALVQHFATELQLPDARRVLKSMSRYVDFCDAWLPLLHAVDASLVAVLGHSSHIAEAFIDALLHSVVAWQPSLALSKAGTLAPPPPLYVFLRALLSWPANAVRADLQLLLLRGLAHAWRQQHSMALAVDAPLLWDTRPTLRTLDEDEPATNGAGEKKQEEEAAAAQTSTTTTTTKKKKTKKTVPHWQRTHPDGRYHLIELVIQRSLVISSAPPMADTFVRRAVPLYWEKGLAVRDHTPLQALVRLGLQMPAWLHSMASAIPYRRVWENVGHAASALGLRAAALPDDYVANSVFDRNVPPRARTHFCEFLINAGYVFPDATVARLIRQHMTGVTERVLRARMHSSSSHDAVLTPYLVEVMDQELTRLREKMAPPAPPTLPSAGPRLTRHRDSLVKWFTRHLGEYADTDTDAAGGSGTLGTTAAAADQGTRHYPAALFAPASPDMHATPHRNAMAEDEGDDDDEDADDDPEGPFIVDC